MNIKQGGGMIPIRNDGENPWRLVDMPSREDFDQLYPRHTPEQRDKLYSIVKQRSQGKILVDIAKDHGLSKDRIRQIEAYFQRKLYAFLSKSS